MSHLPDSETVWQVLRTIPDPEFGVSLVDLGLIYSVECSGGEITVVMTLTTPSCPSGGWMLEGVRTALERLPGATHVRVDLVFDPEWNPGMISEEARRLLAARE